MRCKGSVNPVINTNPVHSHATDVTTGVRSYWIGLKTTAVSFLVVEQKWNKCLSNKGPAEKKLDRPRTYEKQKESLDGNQ
jgi:hypothetical protein